MSDSDVWKILEEQGIRICQHNQNNYWWGYSIASEQLSVDWSGPYESRQEALQAVVRWMMSEVAEHLSFSGAAKQVRLHTYPIAPHYEEVATFEQLLDEEKLPDEQLFDGKVAEIMLDSADVIYNEDMGRVEFRSTSSIAPWKVWREGEWILEITGKTLLVPSGQLYPVIFREVSKLIHQ